MDAVLITKADLEGYNSCCEEEDKESQQMVIIPKATSSSFPPMIAKLSYLFASLRVSSGCRPDQLPVPEAQAC